MLRRALLVQRNRPTIAAAAADSLAPAVIAPVATPVGRFDLLEHRTNRSPVVSLVAIALAFDRSSSILDLVSNAWAGFGAAFGPLILFSLYRRNMSRSAAIAGMVVGALVVLFWLYAPITIGGNSLSSPPPTPSPPSLRCSILM